MPHTQRVSGALFVRVFLRRAKGDLPKLRTFSRHDLIRFDSQDGETLQRLTFPHHMIVDNGHAVASIRGPGDGLDLEPTVSQTFGVGIGVGCL